MSTCPGAMCEYCYGDGACQRAKPPPPPPPAPSQKDDLSSIGRSVLEAEVRAHRTLWRSLASALQVRDATQLRADLTKELPPPQTNPYVQARTERIDAVLAVVRTDRAVVGLLRAVLAKLPFQKSG